MTTTKPGGFDGYWDAVDEELARFPHRPVLEPIPLRSNEQYTVHRLAITSIGPYRIFGYFSVPVGDGPFPAVLETPRYGSVNNLPDHNDRRRYVVLTLMHRGQRLADQPFAASYPGLLTHGIEDPATYVYRGIVADCLRGAEFLLAREEVDPERVAAVGDDLALITTARRSGFAALRVDSVMLYRAMQARALTEDYPLEELNDHLRANPATEDHMGRVLDLFDPLHHAPRVKAKTLLSIGDDGSLGGFPRLEPLAGALGGPAENYRLTHEGRTDHDRLDAWLAGMLGAEPASRFINDIKEI